MISMCQDAAAHFLLGCWEEKRVVLNFEDKLKICDYIKNGRSFASVAAEFNIGNSTVYDTVKNKSKLQAFMREIEDGDCIKKKEDG